MFYVQILELLMHGYLHTIAGEKDKASRKLEKKRSKQVTDLFVPSLEEMVG